MGNCCDCFGSGSDTEKEPFAQYSNSKQGQQFVSSFSESESGSPQEHRRRYQPMRMEQLRIPKVDAMFERAATPYNIIVENYSKIEESRRNFFEALKIRPPKKSGGGGPPSEPEAWPFLSCYGEIQKRLDALELYVVYDNQYTLLSIEDIEKAPDEVRRATKHFRMMIDATKQLLETAPRVRDELRASNEEARRMLDELGTLAKESGLNMMQKLAAPKTFAANRTQLNQGPENVHKFIVQTEELLRNAQEDARKFDKEK